MLTDDTGAFLSAFGVEATYAVASNAGALLTAIVEDGDEWSGMCSALRTAYDHGQVRLGRAWVLPADLPAAPAFGHTLEQAGVVWTVQDSRREGDMLVLGLALGVFIVDVTVQRLEEVSDGALGYKPAPETIWTGRAAVHGLGGEERLRAAREVGVGSRSGWLPACPDLAPGCVIVTPHEVLHVTSAYTDRERGWTVFTAEARQDEQEAAG